MFQLDVFVSPEPKHKPRKSLILKPQTSSSIWRINRYWERALIQIIEGETTKPSSD